METLEALVFICRRATREQIQQCAKILGAVDLFVGNEKAVTAILAQRSRGEPDPRAVDLKEGGSKH